MKVQVFSAAPLFGTMSNLLFTVTNAAEERIQDLLASEVEGARLRIKVLGGGCSGFKYEYIFDTKIEQDDKIFGISKLVVIDDMSLTFLENSELDFYEDLGQAGFIIKNPNSVAKCGCGNSFAI